LVMALVTWSPAWCCCAMGAAVDGEAEVAAFCQGRWSGAVAGSESSSSSSVQASANLPPCCMARALDSAAPDRADEESDAEPRGAGCCDDDSQCNCGERPNELTRLDTAGKVTMPTFERIELVGVVADIIRQARSPHITGYVDFHHHPVGAPSSTLFAQRCLLLT
jgi:hypothetical protein